MMKQKGVASYYLIFLAVIIIAAGVLVGGMSKLSLNNSPVNTSKSIFIPEDITTTDPKTNLQLRTITFREIKLLPAAENCINGINLKTNERDILWATIPGPGETVTTGQIKVFYQDEWPVTLGKTGSGLTVTPPNNSPNQPGHAAKPSLNVGDKTLTDSSSPPLPWYPALFITDITNDSTSTIGDVQTAGAAAGKPPSEIYGTWKAQGANPGNDCRNTGESNYDMSSPYCNGLNTGGPDAYPATSTLGTRSKNETGTSAEIIWNVADLDLPVSNPQRTYRVQIVVHDGDQVGDVGIACTTIKY